MAEGVLIRVTLACSPGPRDVLEKEVEVPAGTTAGQALAASAADLAHGALDLAACGFAVWGKKVGPQHVLAEGDRLEILRPLKVDPKTARRERFSRQGTRGAGLFANRRPGSKQGY